MSEAADMAKALKRMTQRNDWRYSGTTIDAAAALILTQEREIATLKAALGQADRALGIAQFYLAPLVAV